MTPIVLLLILASVLLNTFAQLALKNGMLAIGHFDFIWENLLPTLLKVVMSPWIVLGTGIYVGSLAVWLMVLSRAPVSIAYPMASLGYVTTALAAACLWGETITLSKILGISVIMVGIYLLVRS